MGLIVDAPITDVTNPIVEVISPITYVRVCTDGSSSSDVTDAKSFDKSIYRVLSMQDDMKALTYPDRVKNEFDLFLQYGERVDSGEVIASFAPLDEYLGSIGVSNGIC